MNEPMQVPWETLEHFERLSCRSRLYRDSDKWRRKASDYARELRDLKKGIPNPIDVLKMNITEILNLRDKNKVLRIQYDAMSDLIGRATHLRELDTAEITSLRKANKILNEQCEALKRLRKDSSYVYVVNYDGVTLGVYKAMTEAKAASVESLGDVTWKHDEDGNAYGRHEGMTAYIEAWEVRG